MADVNTTKLSSKGQVVIPEAIRKRLGLEPGTQFVVVGRGDTVVLKTIVAPDLAQFDELMADARRAARKAGLKRADVQAAIKKVRARG